MKNTPAETTAISASEMNDKVEGWQLPPDNEIREYTSNEMIHAYSTGVTEGMEKDEKLFVKQIKENSASASIDTRNVIDFLKDKGITPLSAHLRIDSRYSVDILVTVSDDDFVKESFFDVYSHVRLVQEKSKTDFYSSTFSFINRSESFNLESLKTDGFVATFAPLEVK